MTLRLLYAYSAFGEVATLGPDGGNSLQFTGRENDGTGAYGYRFRYYDPVLKRFISEDPIGMMAGPNFYVYVNDAPTAKYDPLGLTDTRVSIGNHAAGLGPRTQEDYQRLAENKAKRDAYKKCIEKYLIDNYGDFFGYWLADDLVPAFSVYSYFDVDTAPTAIGTSLEAAGLKGGAVGGLSALGRVLSRSGFARTGAAAKSGAYVAAMGAVGAGTLLATFATTVHRGAQLACGCD